MKRISTICMMIVLLCFVILACMSVKAQALFGNNAIFDFTYSFEKAVIRLGDYSVAEGSVISWTDYEENDWIQIKMSDGNTYLTHICNVVLISE